VTEGFGKGLERELAVTAKRTQAGGKIRSESGGKLNHRPVFQKKYVVGLRSGKPGKVYKREEKRKTGKGAHKLWRKTEESHINAGR